MIDIRPRTRNMVAPDAHHGAIIGPALAGE